MKYNNLTVTSIPKFIEEYLHHDNDNQLKSISKEVLNILNSLSFEVTKKGYRNIIYTTIPDIDNYRFTLNIFFTFVSSKITRAENSNDTIYSKELGIKNNLDNESFEAIVIDEYGDKILYALVLEDYNKDYNTLSFMLL